MEKVLSVLVIISLIISIFAGAYIPFFTYSSCVKKYGSGNFKYLFFGIFSFFVTTYLTKIIVNNVLNAFLTEIAGISSILYLLLSSFIYTFLFILFNLLFLKFLYNGKKNIPIFYGVGYASSEIVITLTIGLLMNFIYAVSIYSGSIDEFLLTVSPEILPYVNSIIESIKETPFYTYLLDALNCVLWFMIEIYSLEILWAGLNKKISCVVASFMYYFLGYFIPKLINSFNDPIVAAIALIIITIFILKDARNRWADNK